MPELELGLVQILALPVNTVPSFVFFFLEPLADSYAPFLVETMGCYSISSTGNDRKTCMVLEHFPNCKILMVRMLLIVMGTADVYKVSFNFKNCL
jgi:hypothetical protein